MNTLLSRLALAALPLLVACAPQAYLIKQPTPSGLRAATPPAAAVAETLELADARKGAERDFNTGVLPATLRTESGAIDPPAFLAASLQAELASRGVAAQVRQGSGSPALKLHSFRMVNHRSNGFAPFVTFTYLAADVDTPSGVQRVAAFVRRGKVPVWSFEEVIEPTLNQPISIAVKELASKIAALRYGYKGSDAQVDALVQKLQTRGPESFMDVHALGSLHNAKALPTLVSLLKDGDEYVRAAATSSLGVLRAQQHFGLLKTQYEQRDSAWADRAMAIKAIGDLGSAESKAYLEQELKRWEKQGTDKEALWTAQIIRLFL